MGAYSEMDIELQYGSDNPFTSDGEVPSSKQAGSQAPQVAASTAPSQTPPSQGDTAVKKNTADEAAAKRKADEDEKRRLHEESEAKRKAEWVARRQAKKAAEVMMAATKRAGDDLEKLTRRSMREFVTEHIQTKCLDDLAFARKVMLPSKSMIRCFWYINRKAQDFILKEMELRGEKPERFERIGGDVPDDLCYQWAEEYFNDPNAEEDKDKDDEFVPEPYYGGTVSTSPKKKNPAKKKETAKPEDPKREQDKSSDMGQMTLGDFGILKESA